MQIIPLEPNLARFYFNYNPVLIEKIKKIPGREFNNKDPLGAYWTVPARNLYGAVCNGIISPGHLFPNFIQTVPKNIFQDLAVEIKGDRLKVTGNQNLQLFLKSIYDLCSYEYTEEDEHKIGSLINVGKNKDAYIIVFPPGLYSRIITFLRHFVLKSYIEHPLPAKPNKELETKVIGVTPRPYQIKACKQIQDNKIPNRATLVMATGAGKTLLSAFIIAQLGVPTVFYTYSLDLLEQTAEVFENVLGIKVGKIGGRHFTIQPITIASIQTIYSCQQTQNARWDKIKNYLETVQCQFIDEGHMLGAETIFAVSKISNAYYSYALTATPYREDGKEIFIEAATGPIEELITEDELIKGGYILPVQVEIYPVQHFPTRTKKYYKLYDKEIIDHWERTRKVVNAVKSHQGKQIIVLVKDIYHGNKLAELLNAPFIHGSTSTKERKETLQKFKNQEIKILIASSILKQGIDLPEAEVLVLAHGGTSLVELMQKVGRVRRPAPGKEYGIVVDFCDQILPATENDIFYAQSKRRIALYENKGFQISYRQERKWSNIS
ncbi:DEAD/DEAH box helicase [Syntrophomonas palmitatica]|uniref:DEAD/DEAH box helicase n=1 Tax=Syntrophomonas palmitatica TaxID=402877 RepID=UPI0006D2482C|nr:DEAD/DEAH box helicase [Syntrophomonas palmitatica]